MGWYEAIKDAIFVADQLRNTELKQKLADVQMECANLAEENARLRQELIDLREKVQTRENMEYKDNVYWRRSSDGKLQGPFCPKCLDGTQKAARMKERSNDHWWRCPVCDCIVERPGPDPYERDNP
ncbi:MAG: hypothetical protein ACXU99_15475 [Thermodesulfobacteriota bacterium]